MLAQFQSLYPTGSLTTELLEIHNGKYIVRSSVQIEGVTRATGMAAADTIEEAEDRSRARALMVLAFKDEELRSEVQQPEVAASPKPSLELASNSSLATPKARVNEHSANSENSTQVTETINTNAPQANSTQVPKTTNTNTSQVSSTEVTKTNNTNNPPASSTQVTETTNTNTPPADSPEVTQPSEISLIPEVYSVEDDSDIYSQEFDKPLPLPTYDEPELDTPIENTDIDSNDGDEEELTSSTANSTSKSSNGRTTKKTTKTSTTKRKKKTEPIDLSDVIAKTDVEMERLSWTPQQGREYLIKTYGKRGRTLLTEEELLDFLQYLESIPTQTELSEADPLAGF
jgi:hypothetical protein